MLFLTNINLNQNELQNAIIQPLATAPSNPKLGQIYTNSATSRIMWYNGSEWRTIGVVVESSETNGKIKVDGVEMSVYELPIATNTVVGGVKVGSGLKVTADGTLSVDVVNNLTSTDTDKPLSAAQGKALKDNVDNILGQIGEMGGGDMMKATYDTNGDGIVDDAEKLGGQLPSYYAKAEDVPTKTSELENDSGYLTEHQDLSGYLPLTGGEMSGKLSIKLNGTMLFLENNEAVGSSNARSLLYQASSTAGELQLYKSYLSIDTSGYNPYNLRLSAINGALTVGTGSDGTKRINIDGVAAPTSNYHAANKQYVDDTLSTHTSDTTIHVTADEKTTWNAKADVSDIPTKLSDLTNDEGFIDNTVSNLANYYKKTESYTKDEVNAIIGNLATIEIQVVDELPATGKSNVIYLVPKEKAQANNAKDEYLWTGTAFEKIGDTEIDLSDYLTKTGDGSSVTATFTQSENRSNLASGESLGVLMGKIAKYFADLKTVAFSGDYDDLTNQPTLMKNGEFTVAKTQKSNNATYSGNKIVNVMVYDSVTGEVVVCDVNINGLKVTVSVSDYPPNDLKVVVLYF